MRGATSPSNTPVEANPPTTPTEPPVANPSEFKEPSPTILDKSLDTMEKKFPAWENPSIDRVREEAESAWERVNQDFRDGKIDNKKRLEEASRLNTWLKQRIMDIDPSKDPVKYLKDKEEKKVNDKGASLQEDDKLLQSIASAIEAINKPRTVVRDPDGRISGIA
jgi:DNA repair ATPase RecN